MARIIDFAAPLGQKAGPGRWNDLDMRMPFPKTPYFERSHDGICSSDWVGQITSRPSCFSVCLLHLRRNGGMTFDEYGKFDRLVCGGEALMHVFSNAFLDVGPIEESIDDGPRFTQYGMFCIFCEVDDPRFFIISACTFSPTKLGRSSRTRQSSG